jgi:hypothetical protein
MSPGRFTTRLSWFRTRRKSNGPLSMDTDRTVTVLASFRFIEDAPVLARTRIRSRARASTHCLSGLSVASTL